MEKCKYRMKLFFCKIIFFMACFHAIMEKNGEENDIRGKVLLKIPKSYSLGVAVSHSPNCCYIRLDDGDKLQESLKAMEQCMETQ